MKKVLFVCVENSNRSQMAEAFARIIGGDYVEAFSAGSRPSGKINPKALSAMAELGYDLSKHQSSSLIELPNLTFDFVATMGCGDECPEIHAVQMEDWALPDPKNMEGNEYRAVRDDIQQRVAVILNQLGLQSANSA
jgi:protein-tyrosine-phosphatase